MTNLIVKTLLAEAIENLTLANLWQDYLDENTNYYFDDLISEIADSSVDCYASSLSCWVHEENRSWDFLEEAVNSGFVSPDNYNVADHIRSAQYLYYYEQAQEDLEDAKRWYALYFIDSLGIETLTPEQLEQVEDLDYNDYETPEEIREAVREIITPSEMAS